MMIAKSFFSKTLVMSLLGLWGFNAAANNSIGIGAGFGVSEYKEYESDTQAIPVINVSGERFYFRGMSAGMYLYKDSVNEVDLGLSYAAKKFKAEDSDDVHLQALDNRSDTGMADISYRFNHPNIGSLSVTASADVLDKTDGGYKVDIGYRKNFRIAEFVVVSPGVGAIWFNDALSEHYYGISGAESAVSGLDEYHPEDNISTYVGLGCRVFLSKKLVLFANGQYLFLSDEITSSPMVDRDYSISASVGLSFNF